MTKRLASLLWTLTKLGKIPPAIRDQAKIVKQETGSTEFHMLSDTHTNHEEKPTNKDIIYHQMKDAGHDQNYEAS